MLIENYFYFFIGLTIGSFLNVVIYRLPEGISIIKPPSHCLECGTRLTPLNLVPVLSYLIYQKIKEIDILKLVGIIDVFIFKRKIDCKMDISNKS